MSYTDTLQAIALDLQDVVSADGPQVNSNHIQLLSYIYTILYAGSGGGGGLSGAIDSNINKINGASLSATNFLPVRLTNGTSYINTLAVSQSGVWTSRLQDGAGTDLVTSTSAPSGSEAGLITRNIPNGTQQVSGTVGVVTKTMQYATGTISTSGDSTIISAPSAGTRIYISAIRLQNEAATANTVIIKSATTALSRVLCPELGDGISDTYAVGREVKLGIAEALVLNLSAATSVGYSIIYWVE